jgi:hypothetical protein
MGVVGEVPDLVNAQQGGPGVVSEAAIEPARGLLAIEIEQEIGRRGEERGVALQDGLMDGVLRDHRLAQALGPDEHDVLRVLEEVQPEDAFDKRPVDVLRPRPVEVGHRLEAAQARAAEAALQAAAGAVLEFGGGERLEQGDGRPAVLGGPGQEVIEIVSDAGEAQAAEVTTQGRRCGRE